MTRSGLFPQMDRPKKNPNVVLFGAFEFGLFCVPAPFTAGNPCQIMTCSDENRPPDTPKRIRLLAFSPGTTGFGGSPSRRIREGERKVHPGLLKKKYGYYNPSLRPAVRGLGFPRWRKINGRGSHFKGKGLHSSARKRGGADDSAQN